MKYHRTRTTARPNTSWTTARPNTTISQRSRRLLCWALKDFRDYIKLFYVSCILGDTTLSNSLLTRDQLCSLQRPEGTQCPSFLSVHSYRNLSQQTTLTFTSDYCGGGATANFRYYRQIMSECVCVCARTSTLCKYIHMYVHMCTCKCRFLDSQKRTSDLLIWSLRQL